MIECVFKFQVARTPMASTDTHLATRDILLVELVNKVLLHTQRKSALLSVRQATLCALRFNFGILVTSVGITVIRVPGKVAQAEI